ncbi:MAG: four helix bundle protein [Bacteroidota bacterium]
MKTYRDLEVWKKSMDLATDVYHLLKSFPKDELYGLVSQLKRASVSIAANIAEGYGRNTTGDYLKHLRYAMASDYEVQTLLELSVRVEIVTRQNIERLYQQSREIERMLSSLMRAVAANPRT